MQQLGWLCGVVASVVVGPILVATVRLVELLGSRTGWFGHARARVLLVTEFAPYAELLAGGLRRAGYRLDSCRPHAALGALRAGRHAIVVSGLAMPALTGLDLLAAVAGREPRAQVILLSGDPTGEPAARALRAGALAVLDKRSVHELGYWVDEAFARVVAPRRTPRGVPSLAGARTRTA